VSARAWPDHPAWMREFVALLRTRVPASPLEVAVGV
jgi:protease I